MKSKYCVRVMRPIFHRAILTVEASSEEAAARAALRNAKQLSEAEWSEVKTDEEEPVVEIALPVEEEEGNSEAELIEYVHDVRHAYAPLRADLKEAEGTRIVPTWLKDLPELATADITQGWCDAVSGVCGE